ncbi:MAG: hypothetical protein LBG19_13355 [Prevotellaceae bacterium]|jgi:hypothetical protein|nr:hypothetical protein [Prevotellaceae bacterium]
MDFITLTPGNIAQEHIRCCLSDKKTIHDVEAKKAWLTDRMQEGLKFVRLDASGKIFIEYMPAENAWMPIDAKGYTLIQ